MLQLQREVQRGEAHLDKDKVQISLYVCYTPLEKRQVYWPPRLFQ